MAVTSISRLAAPIIAMGKAATAAGELLATIDADPHDQSGLKAPEVSPDQDITFKDVSFVYPSRKEVQVLDKLSVTFETGKVTAIVGPSGSGKSTIVGLLEKWYALREEAEIPAEMLKVMRKRWERRPDKKEKAAAKEKSEKDAESQKTGASDEGVKVKLPKTVVEGAVFVGKTNLSEIDAKWWRSQIGLVQQEPFLFNDTILQNVAYGLCGTKLQDLPEEEKLRMVKEACQEAFADEFITKLPLVSCRLLLL
jgi:ATP-binding cassette, subfamily B (MDR/TAP), member 1